MTESPLPRVDVRSPKGPAGQEGPELLPWARQQLRIATEIMDNPGGGLLFAGQALGQVRATLLDEDPDRYAAVAGTLRHAEDLAVHRDFAGARAAIQEALGRL